MSQEDVIKILEENPKGWFTSRQIYEKVVEKGGTIGLGTITINIQKLVKNHDIFKQPNSVKGRGQRGYVYRYTGDLEE